MNPVMQYNLIMQNIDMMANPNDIIFELYQLGVLVHQNYDKEINILKNPNIMGEPKLMHKEKKLITDKFMARPVQFKKYHHKARHRKTDISAPTNARKGYTQAHKQAKN